MINDKKALIIAHNHPQFFPGGAEIFAYDLFKAIRSHTEYQPFLEQKRFH